MEKVTKEIEVYMVNGKEFYDYDEAIRYREELDKLKNATFVEVSVHPDLTEGKGYSGTITIGVIGKMNYINAVVTFLLKNHGKPIERVMGSVPVENWIIGDPFKLENDGEFKKLVTTKVHIGIGDHRRKDHRVLVFIDGSGEVVGNWINGENVEGNGYMKWKEEDKKEDK